MENSENLGSFNDLAATSHSDYPLPISKSAVIGLVLAFFIPMIGLILSIVGAINCYSGVPVVRGGRIAIAGIIVSTISFIVAIARAL
jgi:hypothetical protein